MKGDQRIKTFTKETETVASHCARFFICACLLFVFFISCESKKAVLDQAIYEGPTITMDSVFTKLSDSAKIVMRLKAPKQNNFENDDREWPHSLYLEYLDDYGSVETTFQADYVYYTAKEDVYRGEGNVVVRNLQSGDELNTELLFWYPGKKEFHTDRFVTIQSEGELHTGEGMTANEDFSSYTILKPTGTITIEENEAD